MVISQSDGHTGGGTVESPVVVRQRLVLLKQHHDELDRFFQQLLTDVDAAYRNYKGATIIADVLAAVVMLTVDAYNIAVLHLTDVSRAAFAMQSLQFAYRPIKTILDEMGKTNPDLGVAQREMGGVANLLMSVSNVVGNALAPSYWAIVIANIRSGHWRTAFTRDPAREIIVIRNGIARQRVEALEAMERQINQMETSLGLPLTFYVCRAVPR